MARGPALTMQHVPITTDDEHDQDHGAAPPGLGQVFSQKHAAAACGTTVTTIRRWRQAGKPPGAYQVASGAWMYPLADLPAAGATVNPPSPPHPTPPAAGVGAGSAPAGEGEEAGALRAELERVRGRAGGGAARGGAGRPGGRPPAGAAVGARRPHPRLAAGARGALGGPGAGGADRAGRRSPGRPRAAVRSRRRCEGRGRSVLSSRRVGQPLTVRRK